MIGFLDAHDPSVTCAADIGRRHVEAYKAWLAQHRSARGAPLHRHTIGERLGRLRAFFERIIEWGYDDAPARVPIFPGDFPKAEEPLPKFLDDRTMAKFMAAVSKDTNPRPTHGGAPGSDRLTEGELASLDRRRMVQIGAAYWLRIPSGNSTTTATFPCTRSSRPSSTDWIAHRTDTNRSGCCLSSADDGSPSRVDHGGSLQSGRAAGIGHVSPHQLRHTLATQAINRGMSLEAIAALLGHRSLSDDPGLCPDRRPHRRRRVLQGH